MARSRCWSKALIDVLQRHHQKQAVGLSKNLKKISRRRVAEEAAKFMASGLDAEYIHAKELAFLMLGVSNMQSLSTNRMIKNLIGRYTRAELGDAGAQAAIG